ncbi:hypothetical protein CSUI_002836, partial [Cystoisospora suis]
RRHLSSSSSFSFLIFFFFLSFVRSYLFVSSSQSLGYRSTDVLVS